jgi:hypothetical protein
MPATGKQDVSDSHTKPVATFTGSLRACAGAIADPVHEGVVKVHVETPGNGTPVVSANEMINFAFDANGYDYGKWGSVQVPL